MQAKLRQKAGSLAGPGWGWVCNEVCDGYVTRSVTRQSKAQYAKRASAAPAIQRRPSCGKKGGSGQGWGWVCNEVCNDYVTRSVTRQSKAQYAKRLRSSSLIAAIQHKPGCGKKRAVMSLARFVHLRCVTRVCNEGVPRGVCNEGCVSSQLVLLQRSVTRSVANVRRGSVTDPSKKITAICEHSRDSFLTLSYLTQTRLSHPETVQAAWLTCCKRLQTILRAFGNIRCSGLSSCTCAR